GSNNGGEITTKILSVIRTALSNGLDVYKYLEYVIQNINETNVNDLLPYSKNMVDLFS
ncbi:MAG TPA: IS66 family transposase, partial [Firmicutes bacterium]|nr:IS66 family transposase [Bacillota bacterium]